MSEHEQVVSAAQSCAIHFPNQELLLVSLRFPQGLFYNLLVLSELTFSPQNADFSFCQPLSSNVTAAYRRLNPVFTALQEVLPRPFAQFADFHLCIINDLVWCTQLLEAGECLHLIINFHGVS